jgi:hypothetical protein
MEAKVHIAVTETSNGDAGNKYNRSHAHFHAIYGEYEAKIAIDTQQVIKGTISDRALKLVHDCATIGSKRRSIYRSIP